MSLRGILVGLIVLATAGFVVGTTLERTSGENQHESAATLKAEGKTTDAHTSEGKATSGEGGESPATHAAATGASGATRRPTSAKHHAELRPLGVNIEAVPFVTLAALASLGLGLAAYFRPRWTLLLLGVAAATLVFALLDVREVAHQSDENRTGLAVLAGAIAAAHLAAAAVAGAMARHARRSENGPSDLAATMAA